MAARKVQLRVMTFNILKGRPGQRVRGWPARKLAAATAIKAFSPDLLGIQEARAFQAEYLLEELEGYEFSGAGRRAGRKVGERVVIFFRSDRFEKVDEGHFWLSKQDQKRGEAGWPGVFPRMVCWARLRARRRPKTHLLFFNTHFDPVLRRARVRAARLLRERISQVADQSPVIVTGDFNASAGTKAYQALLTGEGGDGPELIDSYRSAHPVPEKNEGTWHRPRGTPIPRRIDWILHTEQFTTVAAAIDRAKYAGRYPSDHFPVTATLQLR